MRKAPSYFKKLAAEKQFKKIYLHYLDRKDDKEFLISCYTLEAGIYRINKDGFEKENFKRLTQIKKIIKSNKSLPINFLPLFATGLIVSAFIIFVMFFMNDLLENVSERALENVFEAKVNINNLEVDLLHFGITLSGITIADRDSPMKNLFDMGRTTLQLNSLAVLRGKIYIEEIRADTIRFSTPRTESGELLELVAAHEAKRAEKAAQPKKEMPPLVDLANFDPAALLEQEYDKLQTPKLYDDAVRIYEEAYAKYTQQVDDAQKQIVLIQEAAAPILAFNINSINLKDPATISVVRKLIEDGKHAYDTAQDTIKLATAITDGIQADIDTAISFEKSARGAITGDINHLKSYLDFSSGTLYKEVLDPVIQDILTSEAQKYIGYGKRGLEILEKVNTLKSKLPEKKPAKKLSDFKGRDIEFSNQKYPFFYLGTLASDFTAGNLLWDFDLRNVSSEPDITGRPASLHLGIAEQSGGNKNGYAINFDGEADFRKSAPNLFNAKIAGAGFPFSIYDDVLKTVGIEGVEGKLDFAIDAEGNRDNSFSAGGGVYLRRPALQGAQGVIAAAVAEAFSETTSLDLGIHYSHYVDSNDVFSLDTNIGDLIMASIKKTAQKYLAIAEEKLTLYVQDYLSQYIDSKYVSKENLETLLKIAKGDKDALAGVQNLVNDKLQELTKRAQGILDDKIAEVTSYAEEQLDQAKAQAEKAAAEAEAEARRRAMELEEEAKRRAEQAVKDAASNALKKGLGGIRF